MDINRLKASKKFMRKLIDVAVTPIFVIDSDLVVQSYNDSFSTLFNRNEKEIIGQLPGNSFGCIYADNTGRCGDSEECVKCILRRQIEKVIREGKPSEQHIVEKEFKAKGKTLKKRLSFVIKPMEFGNDIYYVCVFNDVTDIVNLEEKVYSQYEKMKRDILFARGLQSGLLPGKRRIGPLEFSYLFRPCETLGGDFLDYYRIDRSHVGVIIADVSGHGVTSSMFTMFLYSILDRRERSPSAILWEAFEEFSKLNISTETYITMLAVVINTRRKTAVFSNAGLTNPPAVIRKNGMEKVEINGIPISNWVEEVEYDEKKVRFKSGERMVIFTDGTAEMRTENSSFIGSDYIYNALSETDRAADELIDELFSQPPGSKPYIMNDDITIIAIDYK